MKPDRCFFCHHGSFLLAAKQWGENTADWLICRAAKGEDAFRFSSRAIGVCRNGRFQAADETEMAKRRQWLLKNGVHTVE